ncbi:ArsC/Spx/MgsR family protein, partial [Escherichia coli]|uniref:ArsC/Spx/MgsR family protein n=1 Tax=Escherichia coli TaxID=562 RepID=UPI0025538059
QNDVTLKMPAFEWVHVQLHQQKGMISLSPPTICNSADKFTDDQLIDFMLQHPILINRPIVVTPLGTKLCRPSEVVLDILPDAQKAAFTKEDGEKVVDDSGKRLK